MVEQPEILIDRLADDYLPLLLHAVSDLGSNNTLLISFCFCRLQFLCGVDDR